MQSKDPTNGQNNANMSNNTSMLLQQTQAQLQKQKMQNVQLQAQLLQAQQQQLTGYQVQPTAVNGFVSNMIQQPMTQMSMPMNTMNMGMNMPMNVPMNMTMNVPMNMAMNTHNMGQYCVPNIGQINPFIMQQQRATMAQMTVPMMNISGTATAGTGLAAQLSKISTQQTQSTSTSSHNGIVDFVLVEA